MAGCNSYYLLKLFVGGGEYRPIIGLYVVVLHLVCFVNVSRAELSGKFML